VGWEEIRGGGGGGGTVVPVFEADFLGADDAGGDEDGEDEEDCYADYFDSDNVSAHCWL